MTYEEFLDFVTTKCMYETIYDDSEGRTILVIALLDAYGMVNRAQRPWVGLTNEEMQAVVDKQPLVSSINVYFKAIEAKLKEKNT